MKYYSVIYFIISTIIVSLIAGCGDTALFDELAENRIKLVVKGTYESNDPRPWITNYPEDDSVYLNPNPVNDPASPDSFMIDIAGVKVTSGNNDQYFANYRKTSTSTLTDTDPFFNGTGFLMQNDDVRPDFYWESVKIYLRKMIFNNATEYLPDGTGSWTFDKNAEVLFQEKTTNGFNFNLFQTLTYYDSLRTNFEEINRIFPLVVPVEDGFKFDNNEEATVLEIRFVVKNFVKKYEYKYIDEDGNFRLRHFFALSDWMRDVQKNEAGKKLMGGNLLACARYYVPGKTATLTASASSSARSAGDRFVIAIKVNHNISEYQPPDRTRPACNTPILPEQPTNTSDAAYIEKILDYSLQYKLYQENYDSFVDCVDTIDPMSGEYIYASGWNDYDSRINSFKLPPVVTWSDSATGGTYTLDNIPVGFTYRIYQSVNDPGSNSLPVFDETELTTVTIAEDQAGSEISL